MRAISILPNTKAKASAMSPNRKRHLARVTIWSVAASALVFELGYLAVGQFA